MQILPVLSVMACVPTVLSSPVTDLKGHAIVAREGNDRGSYNVPGLGATKQAVLKASGNTQDLAIAMMETEKMTADYTYGDSKSGDAASFGIFKQNWYMLRTSASEFLNETTEQFKDGAILNSDLSKDIKARHDGQEYYGYDIWSAGHRNGATGVKNSNTDDVLYYKDAVAWIQHQIDSDKKYQTDDTRFWVGVTAM